ncbi:MaoC/PaaZ C-terminal domain-containing protein [Sphingomonas sp. AOB5]|uniref:MaoC/PaaZ C-terminal domain-containing protein n=1 Tax=Sphingomonas sp. AOB5 TaxID=3034017 RepID=UPI0023F6A1C9|nr:MaoC/PaaZ C-terminal domain-containing protein [Sphingomonas sp. AOB5]MDF7776441.1 MaoC/PaaZ C-terminal domain-containing protein [Sphingomonas sp. AOB5]
MPLDPVAIRAVRFPEIEHTLEERDCLLYALSLGLGRAEAGDWGLRYSYERELQVFPTQAVTIGHPGMWLTPDTGVTHSHVVHGGQKLRLLAPMRAGMTVVATNRVAEIADKGEGRGAIIILERTLTDKASGDALATMEWTIFCRNDGGFGGDPKLSGTFTPVPDRAPDWQAPLVTTSDAAMLYRLNGDRNPIHADPGLAKRAGFERPILHGLCLYGMAAAAIMRRGDAGLVEIEARFSSPSFPGEPMTLSVWDDGDGTAFEIIADARGKRVVDHGKVRLA